MSKFRGLVILANITLAIAIGSFIFRGRLFEARITTVLEEGKRALKQVKEAQLRGKSLPQPKTPRAARPR